MSFSRSLKEKSKVIWEKSYRHPFVQCLGEGTLEKERFQFYLLQDYLYLLEYAKVFALGAVKSPTEELMCYFTEAQYGILHREMDLHRQYMKEFLITEESLLSNRATTFNQAYTSNMLAIGLTNDLPELIATVFPCAWSYYDFACRLKEEYGDNLLDNPYSSWIDMYSSSEFYQSFEWFFGELDKLCENKSEEELKQIENIFYRSMEFEYLFWEMSYQK